MWKCIYCIGLVCCSLETNYGAEGLVNRYGAEQALMVCVPQAIHSSLHKARWSSPSITDSCPTLGVFLDTSAQHQSKIIS